MKPLRNSKQKDHLKPSQRPVKLAEESSETILNYAFRHLLALYGNQSPKQQLSAFDLEFLDALKEKNFDAKYWQRRIQEYEKQSHKLSIV